MSLAVDVLAGISSSVILYLTPASLIHADESSSLSSGGCVSHLRWCLVHCPCQLCLPQPRGGSRQTSPALTLFISLLYLRLFWSVLYETSHVLSPGDKEPAHLHALSSVRGQKEGRDDPSLTDGSQCVTGHLPWCTSVTQV